MKIKKVICNTIIGTVLICASSSVAETCTVDAVAIISDNMEKFIVHDSSGLSIGYIVQNGDRFLAYSEKTDWFSASFESKDVAKEAICNAENQ